MDQPGIRFFESCGYGALFFARTTWSSRESQRNSETSRSRAKDFQSNRFLSVCRGWKPVEKTHMIAPLAKFIDRSVLQIGYAMLPQSTWREAANERDLKLEQAVQFLNGPDFIPAESQPAQLDFIPDASGGRFRFPTPRPCEFAENNVVHGRLYRCADAWQERPVIVGLHGGGDFPGNQFGFHLFARRCLRAGFNAATLELPYHFQRFCQMRCPFGGRPLFNRFTYIATQCICGA